MVESAQMAACTALHLKCGMAMHQAPRLGAGTGAHPGYG